MKYFENWSLIREQKIRIDWLIKDKLDLIDIKINHKKWDIVYFPDLRLKSWLCIKAIIVWFYISSDWPVIMCKDTEPRGKMYLKRKNDLLNLLEQYEILS